MMIRNALFVILLCMSGVKMESEDIGSSGEGETTAMSSTADSQFINNEGDLVLAATINTLDLESIYNTEANFDEENNDNTTTTREAKPETTTTTFAPTTTPTPDTTTTTTPYPTTVAETTTTSMETTTTTTTTTTTAPETTTTPKPTTTTTKKPTTTTRHTTRRTTTKSPITKSTSTVFPSLGEITEDSKTYEDQCEFIDSDLKCDVEVMCYGEGELDCSDTADGSPSEPSILNKIFSPTFEEISDEYDDMGSETIPTFPPENVGKTMFPSLFKFGSLATTEFISTVTPEDTTTEAKVTQQETTVRTTTTTERPTTTSTVTTTKATTTVSTTVTEMTTMAPETEVSANATVSEMGNLWSAFPSTVTDNLTFQNLTLVPEEASTTATNVDSEGLLVRRRKREDIGKLLPSASSSMSVSMHVAALEGPKQKVKTCRIIGTMTCSPIPTRDICRGRSACQVIPGTSKTSEKTTSAKSLVNWTIAVIVMCIIAGILTLSIVVYFVVTSWKKLKVQPQNGVTTLTYVNSTPP